MMVFIQSIILGIEEAWKNYSTEKNTKNVIKILKGLHEIMKNPP